MTTLSCSDILQDQNGWRHIPDRYHITGRVNTEMRMALILLYSIKMKQIIIIVLIHVFFLSAVIPADEMPLVFALPSGEEGLTRNYQWKPIIEYLGKISGFRIKLEMVKDHHAILNSMEKKLVDFAFVNPIWFRFLDQKKLHEILVRCVIREKDNYRLLCIVHKDSILLSSGDLAGVKIFFTDSSDSRADYYLSLALLAENGFSMQNGSQFIFSDTDLSILKGVVYKTIEAGFVNSCVLMHPENTRLRQQIRVILKSDPVPQWTVVMRMDVQDSRAAVIKKCLLAMSESAEGKAVLNDAGFDGFRPVKDKEYLILQKYLNQIRSQLAPAD